MESTLFKRYKTILANFEQSTLQQTKVMDDLNNLQKMIKEVNQQSESSITEVSNFTKALKSEIYTVLSSFELVSRDLRSFGQDLINYDSKKSQKNE